MALLGAEGVDGACDHHQEGQGYLLLAPGHDRGTGGGAGGKKVKRRRNTGPCCGCQRSLNVSSSPPELS